MTTPGITGSLQHRLSESVSEDCLHTLDGGKTALRERLGVSQNVCQKLAFPQAQEGFVLGEILGEVQEDFVQSHTYPFRRGHAQNRKGKQRETSRGNCDYTSGFCGEEATQFPVQEFLLT